MNNRKYAIKNKFEEQQKLDRIRRNQKKDQQINNYNNFGVYDFLFLLIIIIASLLFKFLTLFNDLYY